MLKKIALVAAVAASASFATYSFFPVPEAHKGQVEVGAQYGWTDNTSDMKIIAGAEFSVIQNLAVSVTGLGYQLWDDKTIAAKRATPTVRITTVSRVSLSALVTSSCRF